VFFPELIKKHFLLLSYSSSDLTQKTLTKIFLKSFATKNKKSPLAKIFTVFENLIISASSL